MDNRGYVEFRVYWVAVNKFKLRCYSKETLSFAIYAHNGNLI